MRQCKFTPPGSEISSFGRAYKLCDSLKTANHCESPHRFPSGYKVIIVIREFTRNLRTTTPRPTPSPR